jgi:hypothetical protein
MAKKEIAMVKPETTTTALQAQQVSEFDFNEIAAEFKIDSSDILISKILLMQPTSSFVGDGIATLGDYRDSVTKEKIGSINDPFKFVPFHFTKCWDIIAPGGKWLRREPFNPGDESLAWEFQEGDLTMKRVKRLDFFGFVPKDEGFTEELPKIVSFRSTGYREGTKILTQFQMNIGKRRLPWSDVWEISGERLKNAENQSYCVPQVQMVGVSDQDTVKHCMTWYKTIKTMGSKVVVDESEHTQSEKVVSPERDAAPVTTADHVEDIYSTGAF